MQRLKGYVDLEAKLISRRLNNFGERSVLKIEIQE